MGLPPMVIAALISAGGGIASSAIGKGKKVEPEPLMPPGMTERDYKRIFGKAEEMAGQQYVAPINDLMKFAYSIPLQYYGGMSPQDISIPGITPFGGGGGMSSGMGGGQNWDPRSTISQQQLSGRGKAPWMQGGGGAPWMSRPTQGGIKQRA